MTTLEILTAARNLISDPAHWTTRVPARNEAHEVTSPRNDDACQWCALGAIAAVMPEQAYTVDSTAAILSLSRYCGSAFQDPGYPIGRITRINDSEGHTAILSAFDKAIQAVPHA